MFKCKDCLIDCKCVGYNPVRYKCPECGKINNISVKNETKEKK